MNIVVLLIIFFPFLELGLIYIHDWNIIHRDIKPENILLDEKLKIKIGDFGLSHQVENKEYPSERCGTPGYMSPEVIDRLPTNTKTDIFSLGVTAYKMLFAKMPFKGETKNQIYEKSRRCIYTWVIFYILVDFSGTFFQLKLFINNYYYSF